MPAGLVNQLITCRWQDMGIDIEPASQSTSQDQESIADAIKKIRSRPKPKFDF